jgi:hypothetical protein
VACAAVAAAAQDAGSPAGPYVIRSVDFKIEGRTKDFVLMAIVDPYGKMVGSSFPDRASLDAFVADKTQLLLSQRVLASATPSYTLKSAAGGGYDVALGFATKDSYNVIGLPYGTYDSNNGLLLSLRGRDYDFLGSAQPLELNLNYIRSPDGANSYGGQLDFTAPFRALGAVWDLGFSESGQYWTYGSGSSITSATITYNLPELGFPASVTAGQSYSYDAAAPAIDPDTWYLGETASATAQIPITGSLGTWLGVDLGPIAYEPTLELDYAWKPGATLQEYGNGTAPSDFDTTIAQALQNSPQYYGRGGALTTVTNALTFGRIDWAGNMREGLSVTLTSREAFNAQYDDLMSDAILNAELFAQWNGKVGVGARLLGIGRLSGHFPEDDLTMLGQYMRGIVDARMTGVQALVLNGNLPVKLFDFPTHVIIGTHALDFEAQAQPFLDMALLRPDYTSAFSSDWLWYSGGLEFLFFPQGFRSFTVRASVGWDLKNVLATHSLTATTPDGYSPYEFYLGLTLLF